MVSESTKKERELLKEIARAANKYYQAVGVPPHAIQEAQDIASSIFDVVTFLEEGWGFTFES